MKRISTIICFLISAAPTLAEDVLKVKGDFLENRYERAQVSGGLVIGAMLSKDASERIKPLFEVTLPQDDAAHDTVCLRVTSRDGTYESANTYALPETRTGDPVTIEYPTNYFDFLRDAAAVARINLGSCDEDGKIIPLLWNDTDKGADQMLNLYVNTAGADTLVAYGTASGEVVARCTQIEEVGGLKYTAACPVQTQLLPRNAPVTVYFDVTRNRVVESYEVQVLLGGK